MQQEETIKKSDKKQLQIYFMYWMAKSAELDAWYFKGEMQNIIPTLWLKMPYYYLWQLFIFNTEKTLLFIIYRQSLIFFIFY